MSGVSWFKINIIIINIVVIIIIIIIIIIISIIIIIVCVQILMIIGFIGCLFRGRSFSLHFLFIILFDCKQILFNHVFITPWE